MNDNVIAIGALGGSGTRICAQILIELGVFMGHDLNNANDNLLFTRLFKNPRWFNKSSLKEKRFGTFAKCMKGEKLSLAEKFDVIYATYTNPTIKGWRYLLKKGINLSQPTFLPNPWGWKEPNTQIYIEELVNFFPRLKYIHVIRHGLDMAFSTNKQQLKHWGYKFGIEINDFDSPNELAKKQLDYWIACNNYVINIAKKLPENFYLLNYQNLCKNPIDEIENILEFLDISIDEHLMKKLVSIPNDNLKTGRYLTKDIKIFTSTQIEAVKNLGFDVDLVN